MKVLVTLFLLSGLLAAQTAPAAAPSQVRSASVLDKQADPNAQKAAELLKQCIAALGGQAYLTASDMEQNGRTYSFYHGDSNAGTLFWRFWKWPDKERVELTKDRDVALVHNGDHGYEITFKGTALEEPQALANFLRQRHYSLENVLRDWLQQPGTALFYDGQALAERQQADSVSVFNAQNEQVTIFLDLNTHLPIKKTFTWRDPKDRERNEEAEVYANYKNVQGIMTPHSLTRSHNGEITTQRFINNVKYNQALAESLFDAKATYDPYKRSGPRE